jgi:hypothetical protein
MTVQAVVIGIAEGPAHIELMALVPSEVRVSLGQLSLYLGESDIERLSTALDQAREVLTVSTSTSKHKEN